MQGSISKNSRDYIRIDDEFVFETKLKQKNLKQYCKYSVFKIWHYLNFNRDIYITKMYVTFKYDA